MLNAGAGDQTLQSVDDHSASSADHSRPEVASFGMLITHLATRLPLADTRLPLSHQVASNDPVMTENRLHLTFM